MVSPFPIFSGIGARVRCIKEAVQIIGSSFHFIAVIFCAFWHNKSSANAPLLTTILKSAADRLEVHIHSVLPWFFLVQVLFPLRQG